MRISDWSSDVYSSDLIADRYYIHWQRCRGSKTHTPKYGTAGKSSGTNMSGMGPAGHQVTAPSGGAVIVVEVAYTYHTLLSSKMVPNLNMIELAAMPVRAQRSLTLPPNTVRSEEHTSELQSLMLILYAVLCLKKHT